jgi:ribokinase
VIVVVGNPVLRRPAGSEGEARAVGAAVAVALAASKAGSAVQLVGRVGDDAEGDAIILALGRDDVGHVALLRDPARPTPVVAEAGDTAGPISDEATPPIPKTGPELEAADVDLALRYLTDFRVIVVAADVPDDVAVAAAGAADWTGASPVVLVAEGGEPPLGLPERAIVLTSPAGDDDGAFPALVGEYAAAIDRGEDPASAFQTLVVRLGWEPAAIE